MMTPIESTAEDVSDGVLAEKTIARSATEEESDGKMGYE